MIEVYEQVAITGTKDEAGTELKGIASELVLSEASGLGASACGRIITPEDVKKIARLQFRRFVGCPLGINEKRKRDAGFLTKKPSVVQIAKSNGGERGPGLRKSVLVFAQLRDKLAAKDSAVVSEKDDHSGILLPQIAEANFPASCERTALKSDEMRCLRPKFPITALERYQAGRVNSLSSAITDRPSGEPARTRCFVSLRLKTLGPQPSSIAIAL